MTPKEKHALPETLEKREMLYGKGAPAPVLVETGEKYLQAGQPDVALLFFQKAGDTGGLERIAAAAMEGGDYFTFRASRQMLGRSTSKEEWLALAANARKAGLEIFARRAEGEASA